MHPSGAFCFFILLAHLSDVINGQAVTVPSNIEAQMRILYVNSTAKMASQVFPVIFSFTNYSTLPSFGFGLNDLNFNQNMRTVYFQTEPANLTSKAVNIAVTINNDTKVVKLSISYISVWEHSGIFQISKTYTNMANISTSAGSRSFQISQGFSFGSTQINALHFIRGFYSTCTTASQILVSVSVVSTSSYLVRVNTTSDCLIRTIQLTFLFYYTDSSTNSAFVYGGDASTYSEVSVNLVTYSRNLINYTNTVFIMALGGFFCFNFASSYSLGWSILGVTNNTASLVFNRLNWQSVYYSYFQIGYIVQPTVTPTTPTVIPSVVVPTLTPNTTTNTTDPTTNVTPNITPTVIPQTKPNTTAQTNANDASPQKSNYLGIIVGLIIGVISVSVAVVVIIKCYFKATVYTLPEKTDFRILPALSF